jgi:hypothetical protein
MTKDEAIDLLSNKDLDIKEVKEIYNNFKDDKEVVGQVAMNLSLKTSIYDLEKGKSETMVELLVDLSDAEDMGSRWAVAKNPHTPVEILEKLSKDRINLVRALIATNPKTPSKILAQLFSDEKIVRDGLSGNPSTPLKTLEILADDKDKMVRMRLAENPSASIEILKKLLNDDDENVAKASEVNLAKRNTIEA